MALMTQAEFAKEVGVSQPRVSKYIRDGIIKKGLAKETPKAKRFKIDSEIAKAELANELDETRITKANVAGNRDMVNAICAAGLDVNNLDYRTSRALNEHYKAALKKIEYEEKKGDLVPTKDVEKEAFECARMVRDSIINIPNRIADQLSVISGKKEIEKLIKKELTMALEGLSNDI